MTGRGVSGLKFVGTVSLGLLTGLSYTLSTLTIPALLTLPNADTAARAFDELATTAKRQLGTLSTVSACSLSLAYLLSPRWSRHPYLIYTTILVVGARLLVSDLVAPYIALGPPSSPSSEHSAVAARRAAAQQKKERARAARARMEASYEVLGSDAHSDGTGSAGSDKEEFEEDSDSMNGEEVKLKVQTFLKKQIVQTAVTAVAFTMVTIGIWGDGTPTVFVRV